MAVLTQIRTRKSRNRAKVSPVRGRPKKDRLHLSLELPGLGRQVVGLGHDNQTRPRPQKDIHLSTNFTTVFLGPRSPLPVQGGGKRTVVKFIARLTNHEWVVVSTRLRPMSGDATFENAHHEEYSSSDFKNVFVDPSPVES